MPSSVARRIVQRAHLILDNRNNASYIADIEVEVVISYTTPLGVTQRFGDEVIAEQGDVVRGHGDLQVMAVRVMTASSPIRSPLSWADSWQSRAPPRR